MKTRLLKSMPRVALQELRPDLQEQNTQQDDEGIEDHNAVDDQDNDQGLMNDIENIDATQEAPATFQYGPLGQERNDDLVPRSQATEFLHKVFKRIVIKRYRNNRVAERMENVGQHVNYGNNEKSDSDSKEDLQEGIPLVLRTQRI